MLLDEWTTFYYRAEDKIIIFLSAHDITGCVAEREKKMYQSKVSWEEEERNEEEKNWRAKYDLVYEVEDRLWIIF